MPNAAVSAETPRARINALRLIEMLTLHEGNVNAVSKALNTRRTQVDRWLDRFGLRADAFRRPRAEGKPANGPAHEAGNPGGTGRP